MPYRTFGIVFGILATILGGLAPAQEYLGILPELAKPEIAEELQIDEEQREQLQSLIRSRLGAAVGLGQTLREAPLDQQAELRAEFSEESERLGFELLRPDQRERVGKFRVKWLGLLSLADKSVADKLNLADWQRELAAQWREKVRGARRGPNADRMRAEAERALRQEISESQWAAWQVQAGLIESSELGEPMPPEENVAEVAAAEPAVGMPAVASLPATEGDPGLVPVDEVRLSLNFQGQPWKDVIRWLAEQADLSVQSDVIPPGSFTYRDRSRTYSVTEAMDIMNGALLNVGFTLFRQGRMLRCIDFEEDQEKAGEVIKELADLVSAQELLARGQYEPVKVLFTLERLDPEEIKDEVEQLLSIQGTVVSLPSSGQLLVTDMAGNVRAVEQYISRAEDPSSSRGSSVQTLPLKNVNAEEVLAVARPLLDLEADTNVSEEIKISTNTFGTMIYAKGDATKLQILKDLVTQMDKAPEDADAVITYETPYIDRHRVVGIDLTLAYEVISQLLAGAPDIRLATDETAKQLVLLARSDEHEMVRETLAKLAGATSDFEVIQLERLDTQLAIAAIKKFFGLADSGDGEDGKPLIDGDLLARQVWVKGTEAQIAQIRSLLKKLEDNGKSNDILGERFRMVPMSGRAAVDALQQAEALWEKANGNRNSIRYFTPGSKSRDSGLEQKSFAPPVQQDEEAKAKSKDDSTSAARTGVRPGRFVAAPQVLEGQDNGTANDQALDESTAADQASDQVDSTRTTVIEGSGRGADIVIMEGPGGLTIYSEDKEAAAQFESLLRMVADSAMMGASEPIVVYLQNIKATAAKELLEAILSGSSGDSGGGGLLGDMAGSMLGGFGGGMFGAMLGGDSGGGSSVGIASGDYSIVADPRLNALVIKAGPSDMMLIEQLLEVIDQVESPFDIETRGQVTMIPVITQDVNQVLSTIKGLYGDRIEGNSSAGRGGGNQQPNPADFINALRGRGGRGGGSGGSSELSEPKISISADTNTNMLIVIAQPQQIAEIRQIVEMIDQAGEDVEEDVQVVDFGAINSVVLQQGLSRVLGSKAQTNSTTSTPSTSSAPASGNDAAADAEAAQRRAQFFQRLQQQGGGFGGFGGGGTGGGGTGRGGTTTGGFGGRGGFGGFGGDNTGGRGGTGGGTQRGRGN